MQDLAYRRLPVLAIAEGATTPDPGSAALAWSSTTSRVMQWSGSAWHSLVPIHVGTSAPSNPQTGDVWIDTTA